MSRPTLFTGGRYTITFPALLEAFNDGYGRVGRAWEWPRGLYRWAYEMGRRQSKGAGS